MAWTAERIRQAEEQWNQKDSKTTGWTPDRIQAAESAWSSKPAESKAVATPYQVVPLPSAQRDASSPLRQQFYDLDSPYLSSRTTAQLGGATPAAGDPVQREARQKQNAQTAAQAAVITGVLNSTVPGLGIGMNWAAGKAADWLQNREKETGTPIGTVETRTPTGSGRAGDWQEDYEPDWNYVGTGVTPEETAARIGTYGKYGQAAQWLKDNAGIDYANGTDGRQKDRFDELNDWIDGDDRRRELVNLMRMTYTDDYAAGVPLDMAVQGSGEEKPVYSDADLLGKGYTQQEISEARQYIDFFDNETTWLQRARRRTANTAGGIVDSIVSAPLLMGENLVQTNKNNNATEKNLQALEGTLDDRGRELMQMMQQKQLKLLPWQDAQPLYSDEELIAKGYTQEEIDTMRRQLEGATVRDTINPEASVGYQIYRRGQELTGAAQAGLTPWQKTALGIAASAGENLTIAAMSPYAVLPMLSAQGAADSFAEDISEGENPETALTAGVLKFGAGWAINSVGVADMARSMGVDYATDTVAGKLADFVRKLAGNSEFMSNHQALRNALSGGIDNAVQAFVETYADLAVDAALGDTDAADSLLTPETFIQALEAGATGGASGALGGFVGTGLGKMNADIATGAAKAAMADLATDAAAGSVSDKTAKQFMPGEDNAANRNMLQDTYGVQLPDTEAGTRQVLDALAGLGSDGLQQRAQQVTEYRAQQEAAAQAEENGTATETTPAPAEESRTEAAAEDAMTPEEAEQLYNVTGGAMGERAAAQAQENGTESRYSIEVDADGKPYVQINNDILKNVPQEKWKTVVQNALKEMFPDGFERNGAKIENTREGRGEFTHSKDTRRMERTEPGVYADKMRMATNLDEIIQVTENVTPENPKHQNAAAYNRGKINVRVGANSYSADVVTAIKNDGREVAYDVVNITPTTIKGADGNASTPSGDLRRTAAQPAEASGRGQPETPLRSDAGTAEQKNSGSSPDQTPDTKVAQKAESVNSETVERTGESVESYAEQELRADMETLNDTAWNRQDQLDTARALASNARMSTAAVQTVVDNMPAGVGAQVYAPAANSLYRLGVMGIESFDKAVQLTGKNGPSGSVRQVMALGKAGRNALELAYLQGQGEAQRYKETKAGELGKRPGKAALNRDSGTYYTADGKASEGTAADDALIELSAKASGVTARRVAQGLENRAKGLLQSSIGQVFYSSEADTATVMHETLHELNSWSNETGQELIDRFAEYLVQQNGMENVLELVQSYLDRYAEAGQSLTYNQAMEEITADAMRSIFGTEEAFRDFVRQQAAEAKMNARAQRKTDRIMTKIDTLLHKVLADIRNVLGAEPDNAAAKAAKTLTEQQLKDLRQLYFNHQAEAGEHYREALEENGGLNKTNTDTAGAAEGRYSIDPEYASRIEEWNREGRPEGERFVLGSTGNVLQGLGAMEHDIYMNGDKINLILKEHPEMTLEEIKRIPEILDDPVMVLTSQNKGRSQQNTRLVIFGNVKAQDGRPVLSVLDLQPVENHIAINDMQKVTSAYTKDNNPVQFVRNSEVLYVSENKKRTIALLQSLGFQLPVGLQRYGSMGSIAYRNDSVKMDGVKFTALERADPNTKRATELLRAPGFQMPGELQSSGSIDRIAHDGQNVKAAGSRAQLEVSQDDIESARAAALGDVQQQADVLRRATALAGGGEVKDSTLTDISRALISDHGSKIGLKNLTNRLKALRDYLGGADVNWEKAHVLVLDIAEQIMNESSHRNDTLWKGYPELHRVEMALQKGSTDYKEVVYRYGSWANARQELARHGINLTQTKDNAKSRWDADYTELQGLASGLLPAETPNSAADALDAIAAAHDAIRPVMENSFSEDWEGAKQDIALQIWERYLNAPEIANEKNAALRKEFAQKLPELRRQAKAMAEDAEIQAKLLGIRETLGEMQDIRNSFAQAVAKATEKAEKAEEWAKQQRDSVQQRVAQEQLKRQQQVQKVRDAREMDNTRRAISRIAGQLGKMKGDASVPAALLDKVSAVVMLADEATGNYQRAGRVYEKTQELIDALEKMDTGLRRAMTMDDAMRIEWENSGLNERIRNWLEDVQTASEEAAEQLRGKIESMEARLEAHPEKDDPKARTWLANQREKLYTLEHGGMAALTAEQLRGLRDILEQTVYQVRKGNAMLGEMESMTVNDCAQGVQAELAGAKGPNFRDWKGKIGRAVNLYKLNVTNIERNFERFGGYVHGGYMEQLGRMLNNGQYRSNKIIAEGEAIFADVTGPEHEQELYHFTHDLIDIGLKTDDGRAWLITHDQLVELWLHLQNRKNLYHITHGGITIDNMTQAVAGDREMAEHNRQTVRVGELATLDKDGHRLNAWEISQQEDGIRTSLIAEIEKNLNDFDNKVLKDYKSFEAMTKKYINETSMMLNGVPKARTENYIRIRVDSDTRPTQNTGIRYDNSVGNEGFLQERVTSSKAVVLSGILNVVNQSLGDVARYAGMAVPMRNVEKVLNSQTGGKNLNYYLGQTWGRTAQQYVENAMADLLGSRPAPQIGDSLTAGLRGKAAAAVLSANLNVTLLQAASLPTAAAELGWRATGKAAVQFARNINPVANIADMLGITESAWAKAKEEIFAHGDAMLKTRLRGTGRGELSNSGLGSAAKNAHDAARNSSNALLRGATKTVDALADAASGIIGKMDELTVVALWEGSKNYVENHPDEFAPEAQEKDSAAYWEAVNREYQRVIERTQPNYTPMQRTGVQRTRNEIMNTVMMFSTQRQQNAQILMAAAEDAMAQWQRNNEAPTEETAEALKLAGKRLFDAVSSQIVQTTVIAILGVAVQFGLRRWDKLEDENGDITGWSLLGAAGGNWVNSAVSNFVGGSELYNLVQIVRTGGDYDTISMTGLSTVNEAVRSMSKLNKLLGKDTAAMDSEELAAHAEKVNAAYVEIIGYLATLRGIPYANLKKNFEAVKGWIDAALNDSLTQFSSAPKSAQSQYDRLYNAYMNDDPEEAAAAIAKLEMLGKTDQIDSQLKTRLQQYDPDVQKAAQAQLNGDDKTRIACTRRVVENLCSTLGAAKGSQRREEIIDLVTAAVTGLVNETLKNGGSSVTDGLVEALDGGFGRAADVQEEYDRLVRAGKDASSLKSRITSVCKPVYLAGSEADREKLTEMLLQLTDASGKALYDRKTIEKWGKQTAAASQTADPYADLR